MRVSAISDVHVKEPSDPADKLLTAFLSHPLVHASDYVLLLGDIFDLMAGAHPQYLKDFAHLFELMDSLVRKGKKVYFIEGNHDVHLEKLFSLYWKDGQIKPQQCAVIEKIDEKLYYFSHGDEHDVHNESYHRYMRFIRAKPLRFFANHILPYSVLNFIGKRASQMSRKKGTKTFDEHRVRNKFRDGVELTTKGLEVDFVIGGHSHVKDDVVLSNGRTRYLNNGYALGTRTFIHVHDHEVSFPVLG